MKTKIIRIFKSKKAEATYISTVIYILIAMILIAFIINIFSIISTKQKLDTMVDQLTKQIQLSGGVNADTEELFQYLSDNQRDDVTIFTVFVFIAVNMLIAFLMLIISVKINCINISNAAKTDLNNVSARISRIHIIHKEKPT